MTRPVVVVPHGTGIGDMVNVRPLLTGIAASRPKANLRVMVPQPLAWLLPEGTRPMGTAWLRLWQRLPPDSGTARTLSRLDPCWTAPPAKLLTLVAARGLTRYLETQGYEVISLLEPFSALDLDTRWTPGPWSGQRRHLIDLLAEWLEWRDIHVSLASRRPSLTLRPKPLNERPTIILSPNAGSTLKEAPIQLWIDVTESLLRDGITPYVLAAPGRDTAVEITRRVTRSRLLTVPDLRDVACALAGADLVVSPDSGILHLAAAAGTRHVGIFGSTDPAFLGPYDQSIGVILQSSVRHETVCRTCWTAQMLPAARCGLGMFPGCLAGINADDVLAGIRRLKVP